MSQLKRTRRLSPVPKRMPRGFTLVEMLVSVTLVLMMMTMFASIFSMATDSVGKQRGISNLDQKARSLVTMFRSDLQHRTFRNVVPFFPGEDPAISPASFGNRAGYLYVSTNDTYSGLDDLIQFTVNSDILIENTDDTPYYGKAQMLSDRTLNTRTSLSINTNQPEADDGSLLFNGTGSSNAAEVCYFVRNGNLYRRVQLLRKPLPVAGKDLDEQPKTARGDSFFTHPDGRFWFDADNNDTVADPGELSDDFWRYFDYSAIATISPPTQHASFIGVSSLSNEPVSAGASNQSLGVPRFRFGFNQEQSGLYSGVSREHERVGGLYIGRFTHAETSAPNFNWPQGQAQSTLNTWTGNPFYVGNPVTLDQSTGTVGDFSTSSGRGGDRRMEDLLLANVHEMKIEIWDERLQKYTVPGHSETNPVTAEVGDYHSARNLNPLYSPFSDGSANVFDTWHPSVDIDFNGSSALEIPERRPPYLAYKYYPPRLSDSLPGPSPDTMPGPIRTYWTNKAYSPDEVVFAPPGPNQTFTVSYRCIRGGQSGATPPLFPARAGQRIQDNEVEWVSMENSRPLSSIRITLRFMDTQSDTQRQLSLIIPLTDKK